MTRFRMRIGTLVIVMVVLAFMLAALREATPLWNELAFSATWLILMTAALLAVHRSGESRAFWIGFATWGIGYLVTTASGLESRLFTTRLLLELDERLPSREDPTNPPVPSSTDSVVVTGFLNSLGRVRVWNVVTDRAIRGPGSTTANFVGVGHSFLALLFGCGGGLLSMWISGPRPGEVSKAQDVIMSADDPEPGG